MAEYTVGDLTKLFKSPLATEGEKDNIFQKKVKAVKPEIKKKTKKKDDVTTKKQNKSTKKEKKLFGAALRAKKRKVYFYETQYGCKILQVQWSLKFVIYGKFRCP